MSKTQAYAFENVGLGLFLRTISFCISYLSLTLFYLWLLHFCLFAKSVYNPEHFSSYRRVTFLLAQKSNQKRALFSDPSPRKAKGQPHGEKIAYAPIRPNAIEGITILFVTTLFLFF
ncbi:hypothetical protein [Xanthocytophaga agilis]|uniref:Uncharacterized protein n=1 Tax=Xanthocytophaga agilis TaxID=3048010 RepID=A0AAE3UEK6_9BACT|nr:hypothetical protein [Xanthocytophaga agilis]MDJ1499653.1 hypothetical protein [Xanthocytophaga agilis]